jgi:hypothetical protein
MAVQVQVLSPAIKARQGVTAKPDPLLFAFRLSLGKILVKSLTWRWGDAAEGRRMASLQERNGSYRVLFCHHGKLHTFTI